MKDTKRSCVFFNEAFFWFVTQAVSMLAVGDPLVEPKFLPSDIDDHVLGDTLRCSLLESRNIETSEFQKMFRAGVFNQIDEERENFVMQKYGYKTKRMLYKNMRCCWISLADGLIEIKPTHQKSLNSYTGISKDGPDIQYLPITIGAAELGSALREGFMRCSVV